MSRTNKGPAGIVVGTLAAIGLLGGLSLLRERLVSADDEAPEPVAPFRQLPPTPSGKPPAEITVLPIAGEASATLASAEGSTEDDLSTIELLLATYGRNHSGRPTGENEEITAALLGKNAKRVAYLEKAGPYLDRSGRLVDRWGTPYFFHSLTASHTEIRSGGPDGEIFTEDDLLSASGEPDD